jgi:hypothetical protein
MKLLFALLSIAAWCGQSHAVEFEAFRATVTLPFINATFLNDTDRFLNTRVSNKQLINLALGAPFKAKTASELVLVVLREKSSSAFAPFTLAVINRKANALARAIATVTPSDVLLPDDPKKPGAGLFAADFSALSNTDFNTAAFTLNGSASGFGAGSDSSFILHLELTGLHGTFLRNAPQLAIYAGVITAAKLRVTGKPIATLDL